MTNYTEHDDAPIKLIGVKQGPRKMSIVHIMCVCVLPAYKLEMNHPVETTKPTGKQSMSQATITIKLHSNLEMLEAPC